MPLDRRALLAMAALAAPASAAPDRLPVRPGGAPDEVWDVWPGRPPGAERVAAWAGGAAPSRPALRGDIRGVARPVLAVWRPARATGGSLLILPGGGYHFVSWANEGASVAHRMLATGATVFVLAYRLPGDRMGWADEADAPLADAQRAMRLIRADAQAHGRDPRDAGVLGFSAGGHLAGRVLTQSDLQPYRPVDAQDAHSARPAYAGLIYPVISLSPELISPGTRDALAPPDAGTARALSVDTHVKPGVAPTFLANALDDTTVVPDHALLMLAALRRAAVPTELHLFEQGGHGFGLTLPPALPGAMWPELFVAWARTHGALGG